MSTFKHMPDPGPKVTDAMTYLRMSAIEQRLTTHLSLGGTTSDDVGRQLVDNFVQHALRASDIKAIVSAAGFTSGDLTEIMVTSIDSLMPIPRIATKLGSGLYGVWALNPDPLREMLPLLTHKINWMRSVCAEDNIPFDSSHRTELIRKFSKEYAIQAQKQSREEFGEASFTIKEGGKGLSQVKGGCLTLLMVGGAVGVGLWQTISQLLS